MKKISKKNNVKKKYNKTYLFYRKSYTDMRHLLRN